MVNGQDEQYHNVENNKTEVHGKPIIEQSTEKKSQARSARPWAVKTISAWQTFEGRKISFRMVSGTLEFFAVGNNGAKGGGTCQASDDPDLFRLKIFWGALTTRGLNVAFGSDHTSYMDLISTGGSL
jgi:hypothetical protein